MELSTTLVPSYLSEAQPTTTTLFISERQQQQPEDLPSSSFEDLDDSLYTTLPSSVLTPTTTGKPVNKSMTCLPDESLRIFTPISSFIWRFIFPVQFTLGVLGNVLNLWVLTSDDVPNNIANDLLAAVSLCDLAFLLSMAPNSLAAFEYHFEFSLQYRLYYLRTRLHLAGFANWMSAAAIWLILAVSIERLLVIRNPLRSKHYWGGARRACVVGAIFILTGALTLYHHFEYDCEIVSLCEGKQIKQFCFPASEPHPVPGSHNRSEPLLSIKYYMQASTVFNAVLVVFLPIIFVCVLNMWLLGSLRTRAAELSVANEQLTVERMKRTTSRVTATVIAIALCFTLTQGPSAVLIIIQLIIGYKDQNHMIYTIMALTNSLVVLGKTTNFLLFCLSSAHFRSKCLSVIFRKFPRLQQSCLGQRFSETFASHPRGSIRTIRSTRRESLIPNSPVERTILEDADGEAYEMMLASRSLSPSSRKGDAKSPEYL